MKTAPYSDTGSFTNSTLRQETLIPFFLECARAYANCPAEHAQLDAIGTRMDAPGYYESEDADFDLDELTNLLNDAAPAGHYFGAHPGDGADFGFWPHED